LNIVPALPTLSCPITLPPLVRFAASGARTRSVEF
jgi:hypothetical protein